MARDTANKQEVCYYRCLTCRWITEVDHRVTHCHRCLARPVQHLTKTAFIAAVEAGEARYCAACKLIHL